MPAHGKFHSHVLHWRSLIIWFWRNSCFDLWIMVSWWNENMQSVICLLHQSARQQGGECQYVWVRVASTYGIIDSFVCWEICIVLITKLWYMHIVGSGIRGQNYNSRICNIRSSEIKISLTSYYISLSVQFSNTCDIIFMLFSVHRHNPTWMKRSMDEHPQRLTWNGTGLLGPKEP